MFRDLYRAVQEAGPGDPGSLLGFASNVGIVMWCTSAAVAAFAAVLLVVIGSDARRVVFLTGFAFLSALLMSDDLFMLHEFVYPRLFGLEEKEVFAIYAILMGLLLLSFRRLIKTIGASLLIAALLVFALAVLADIADDFLDARNPGLQRWLEDGTKLVGGALWTAFAFRASLVLCLEAMTDARRGVR